MIDLQELKAAAQKQTGRFDFFRGISPEDLLALIEVYESRPKCEIVREIYSVGNKVSNVFFQSKEDATNYLKEYGTGSNGLYISTIPVIANTKIKEKE